MITWHDPHSRVSAQFNVHDCLYLPKWGRLANEDDGLTDIAKTNLIYLCKTLDKLIVYLDAFINVHSMFRPPEYSKLVGGSEHDVHTYGRAIDFDCNPQMTCDEVKQKLLPVLEKYGLRLEDNGPQASWCHLDTHSVATTRFFKP